LSDGRVLVTGGTGFIGSRIVGALAARGKPVRCLVRGGESPREGVEAAAGDMTDGDSLRRAAEGCDVVVHLVAGKLGLPAEFQNKMAQATKNLIGAAKDAGVQRLVLMSSLGTDERTAGLTAYSRAKWEAQQALQASGLEWTVFKPNFVFGADGGMLPSFKKLARGPVIVVPGNGKRRLQPIWVDGASKRRSGCRGEGSSRRARRSATRGARRSRPTRRSATTASTISAVSTDRPLRRHHRAGELGPRQRLPARASHRLRATRAPHASRCYPRHTVDLLAQGRSRHPRESYAGQR
jgi:putative NADH-flavin reductase